MTDERKLPDQEKEPELKRPDEAIKDLEPDEQEGDAVKGGYIYQKIKYGD